MQEISRAEFAKMVGVSRAAVTIAANNGRFTPDAMAPDKKLRLPAALEQWKANRDQRGLGTRENDDELELDDDDNIDETKSPSPETKSIASEKQRAFKERADKLALDNAERRGELISRDQMTRGLQDAGVKIASDIEAITGQAEKLASIATGDVPAMRAALREIARTVRTAIADRLVTVIEGGDDDADGE